MELKTSLSGRRILARIHKIKPFIQATLSITKKRCSSATCRCLTEGPIHETAQLTWKDNKKTNTLYVPKKFRKEVAAWVKEGKLLKQLIMDMSKIQRELLSSTKKRKQSKQYL